MASVIDTEAASEQSTLPKEDLGYLKRKRWFAEFLPRIRDAKRDPLDRLEDIEALVVSQN